MPTCPSTRNTSMSSRMRRRRRASLLDVQLVMTNTGAGMAQDIDAWLRFPPETEVLTEENLPAFPDEPPEPQRPRSPLDSMVAGTPSVSLGIQTGLFAPQGVSEPMSKGPDISNTDPQEVRYWLRHLKHGTMVDLAPLFVKFRDGQPRSFGIAYSILVGNHPEPTEGLLPVVLSTNSRPGA